MRPHQVPVDSIPSLRKLFAQPRARAEVCIDTLWAVRARALNKPHTHPLAEACAAPVKRAPLRAWPGRSHNSAPKAARMRRVDSPALQPSPRLQASRSELLALRRLGPIQGKPPEVLGLLALSRDAHHPLRWRAPPRARRADLPPHECFLKKNHVDRRDVCRRSG